MDTGVFWTIITFCAATFIAAIVLFSPKWGVEKEVASVLIFLSLVGAFVTILLYNKGDIFPKQCGAPVPEASITTPPIIMPPKTSPPITTAPILHAAREARDNGDPNTLYASLPHKLAANDMGIVILPNGDLEVFGKPWYGDQRQKIQPDSGYCNWRKLDGYQIVQIIDASTYAAALTNEGKVVVIPYVFSLAGSTDKKSVLKGSFSLTSSWDDVVQIDATPSFIVGLQANGMIRVAGDLNFNQSSGESWRDIVQIAAGRTFVIGLTSDGMAQITLQELKKDVSKWNKQKIVQVAGDTGSSTKYALGLTSEGTVVTAGQTPNMDFSSWNDIIFLCARFGCVLGLQSDGTVLATGRNMFSGSLGWRDMIEIDIGNWYAVGMKDTGEIVSVNASVEPRYDRESIRNVTDYLN